MDIKLDLNLIFPVVFGQTAFDKLVKYCGSVEDVEQNFQIEFSCGDGKYFSDLWKWTDGGEGLHAVGSDEELEKYDGKVCLIVPPRLNVIKMSQVVEQLKAHTIYRFVVKYYPKNEEEVYYINSRERNRRWVG
jgi:hypothetical protein